MENRTVVKRTVKDSVFTALFSEPKYLKQLCMVLKPDVTESELESIRLITIQNVIVNDQYNDLAFTIGDDTLMFLVEAQSTWTANILVRIIMYYAKEMQELISKKKLNVYSGKKLSIPKPVFYVVYTGSETHTEEYISLAEEFFDGDTSVLEVKVKLIHMSDNDNILDQYIKFTKISDEQVRLHGRSREVAAEIIRKCVDSNILKEFLLSREMEVIDMLDILFDQEYVLDAAIEEAKRDAKAEGEAKGRAEGLMNSLRSLMENMKLTAEQAMAALNIPSDEYEKYRELLNSSPKA